MPDLSSVAREAAEAEGLRRIPPQWMAFHGGTTADMMAAYRKHFIDGFTECASRLPDEVEIAKVLFSQRVSDNAGENVAEIIDACEEAARADLALIGGKIST